MFSGAELPQIGCKVTSFLLFVQILCKYFHKKISCCRFYARLGAFVCVLAQFVTFLPSFLFFSRENLSLPDMAT